MEMKGEKTRCASLPYLKCIIIIIVRLWMQQMKVGIENDILQRLRSYLGFSYMRAISWLQWHNEVSYKMII